MSAPTRHGSTDAPRLVRDRLGVEHGSVYVSRRRVPRLPRVPRGSLPPVPARARPFGIASAIAACWAAAMGLMVVGVPVLLGWALSSYTQSSARDAAVLSADLWLGSHHVGFFVDGQRFALLPLGLLVLPFLLLRLSGGWAARILRPATLADAGLLVVATSVIYGLIGGVVAALVSRPGLHANPFEAILWCTLVALVSVGWTVVRTSGLGADVAARLPLVVRQVVKPAALGLLAVLAGSLALVLIALLARGGDALSLGRAVGGGVVGGTALLVLSVAYLPNLAIWGASFAIGPGFAVGTGTSVTLAGVATGPLPAFPLFAALPSSGVPAAWTWSCLVIPLAAGVVAAVATTRSRPGLDPESTALWAGVAGACSGLALGGLAWLAGGPLGSGRLSVMGPSPWQVGVLAAIEIGLVAAVAGWVTGWRATRPHARAH